MDPRTDGRTYKPTYRDARMHLKVRCRRGRQASGIVVGIGQKEFRESWNFERNRCKSLSGDKIRDRGCEVNKAYTRLIHGRIDRVRSDWRGDAKIAVEAPKRKHQPIDASRYEVECSLRSVIAGQDGCI